MTVINEDKKVDYWDQVETSQSFNTGITGNKLISDSHVQARKPGETDWFRVFGTKPDELQTGLIVKLKVDNLDQDYLVIGPEEFKAQMLDGFKKGRVAYLAPYITSSNRLGVWPVTIPEKDNYGKVNAWNATAFQIMERAQHEWVQMKSNMDNRVYDGWTARPEDQEMFGQPKFPIEPKEVIKKAFNDKVITPGNFESNPYVMRVLAATQIQTGEKV